MLSVCFAAKGGSGTTVVAASMAIAHGHSTLLVDLAGDIPSVLGLADSGGPGVLDWIRSDAPPARLDALTVTVGEHLGVLPRGAAFGAGDATGGRWRELRDWLHGHPQVIVDAGTGDPPPALAAAADQLLLVTRPCYLALRAAVRLSTRPTGVIVVAEPGRSLTSADVAASVGAPVLTTLLLDPGVARAVDAGLLAARPPLGFRRALKGVA
jgi:hypothetical protein